MLLVLLSLFQVSFAQRGSLLVFAFEENQLADSVVDVTVLDQNGTPQENITSYLGASLFSLEPGQYQIEYAHRKQAITVFEGRRSEIIFSSTGSQEVYLPTREELLVEQKEEVVWSSLSIHVEDWDGKPIPNAQVLIRGRSEEGTTDEKGNLSLRVPKLELDIVVFQEGFISRNIQGHVVSDELLKVRMSPAGYEIPELSIVAPRIEGSASTMLARRKEASNVEERLGSEQMTRAGDSDAASALKRVTGLTVVGGKFVYVRGLGERYSASLLNQSSLPSTDPERRVVPLDLFPTSLLRGISIQKTFSPERPAEFGGGVISLETRGVPEDSILRFGISSAYIDGTTGLTGDLGVGYDLDWTGFGAGNRMLPNNVDMASSESPLEERDMFSSRGYTSQELEQFGESINKERWSLEERVALPPVGIDILYGKGWNIRGVKTGVLAAGLWKNSWDVDSYDRSYYLLGEEGRLEESHVYRFDEMTNQIQFSAALILEAIWDGGFVRTTSLLNRDSSLRARWYEGFNRDVATEIRVLRTGWVERSLFFQQLAGQQEIGKWTLDVRYAFSQANREEPDRRETRYDFEPGNSTWYLSDRPEGNSIFYSSLLDFNHDWNVQLARQFALPKSKESILRFGLGRMTRDRGVDTRRYKYMHKGGMSYDSDVLSREPEDIFSQKNIGSTGFQFEEVTRQTDNYKADQQMMSGYAMGDFRFGQRLGILTGFRVEQAQQNVETYALFNPDQEPVLAQLDNLDVLPAATVSYDLGPEEETDRVRLRFGYGKTLSRPDFRELSPATFNDVTGGRQVYGNPDLERALIDNVDLRWEWYPTAQESLSIGGFYKNFDKPIESIVVVSAQHSVTYQNAERAENKGLELDARVALSRMNPRLEGLFAGGNASWIHSQVELGDNSGIQSSDIRALEGQSPYVYNLQLSYDDQDDRWGSTLLYNVFGPRIMQVGALGAPDYFELPVHRLDWISFFNAGDFRWALRIKNLLDAPIQTKVGDTLIESRTAGRSIGLQLRWSP